MDVYTLVLKKDHPTGNVSLQLLKNGGPTGTWHVFNPPVTLERLEQTIDLWWRCGVLNVSPSEKLSLFQDVTSQFQKFQN